MFTKKIIYIRIADNMRSFCGLCARLLLVWEKASPRPTKANQRAAKDASQPPY